MVPSDNYKYLNARGIDHFIPLWGPRVGKQEKGFIYNKEENYYECEEGKKLEPLKNKDPSTVYRSLGSVCKACPKYETCVPESYRKGNRVKVVRRHKDQEIFEEILTKSQSPLFKNKLRERMWKIEGVFAEAKNQHLLNRAKYRRKWKVQIQAYMIATVQNLKRLMANNAPKLPFW